MAARAESAARTRQAVLDAAVALWRDRPLDAFTLADIAAGAGVSVRTVLRRFGSREGVIAACMEADAGGVVAGRGGAGGRDVDAALDALLAHYERDGDAVLRTLALERSLPEAAAIAEAGRGVHRDWCAGVFAEALAGTTGTARRALLDAFVAATDLSTWKLLRRDAGRSADATAAAIRVLVQALLAAPARGGRK